MPTIKERIIHSYHHREPIDVSGHRTTAYAIARTLGLKGQRQRDGRFRFILRDRTKTEIVLDALRNMHPKYMHATPEEISLALRAAKLA